MKRIMASKLCFQCKPPQPSKVSGLIIFVEIRRKKLLFLLFVIVKLTCAIVYSSEEVGASGVVFFEITRQSSRD